MKEFRSASQILFGFLPEQTVDVRSGVWKVRSWRNPKIERNVDMSTLRKELCRLASQWRACDMDWGFVRDLECNAQIQVLSLDRENGVDLIPFPESWVCQKCKRIHNTPDVKCQCGYTGKKGQLPFVAFHDKCGSLKMPQIPRCQTHKQVRIVFPGTATATEIRFECPVCNVLIRKGFGFPNCDCGQGRLSFNVHRSSTVYTPRSVVIVNPPTPENLRAINEAGGRSRALEWVVGGMTEARIDETKTSIELLRQQLKAQGLPDAIVGKMIEAARESGEVPEGSGLAIDLPGNRREDAEDQAVTIALAAANSRVRIKDLADSVDPLSEIGLLYKHQYKIAQYKAGLEAVELVDKFPVLTGHFGYTRGGSNPGESRLKTFRNPAGIYQVYADIAETEALFVKLSARRVATWLAQKGFALPAFNDEISARVAILKSAEVPKPGEESNIPTVGSELLTLIHSYAHRFIRLAAVWAGIDRNALSELLVPLHLGFYMYAAARGDFVLGGLQAVFESELDHLLHAFVHEEQRCPLDPGCSQSGGACVACLHLGEPSCRYYNRFLSRHTLVGEKGYLEISL